MQARSTHLYQLQQFGQSSSSRGHLSLVEDLSQGVEAEQVALPVPRMIGVVTQESVALAEALSSLHGDQRLSGLKEQLEERGLSYHEDTYYFKVRGGRWLPIAQKIDGVWHLCRFNWTTQMPRRIIKVASRYLRGGIPKNKYAEFRLFLHESWNASEAREAIQQKRRRRRKRPKYRTRGNGPTRKRPRRGKKKTGKAPHVIR